MKHHWNSLGLEKISLVKHKNNEWQCHFVICSRSPQLENLNTLRDSLEYPVNTLNNTLKYNSIFLETRGWPKLKSSGLNQKPTRKKASRLGTRFGEFSSSWYPVRYPFSDFLVRPRTSGLKFLVQPESSCLLQELLGFYQEVFGWWVTFPNNRSFSKMYIISSPPI